jgi:hypothetical protein
VCRNGAVIAHALEAWRLEQVEIRDAADLEVELRDAIHACASPAAFENAAAGMRAARLTDFGSALLLLSSPHGAAGLVRRHLPEILRRLEREEDRETGFGLMNAVTSLARDTRDPDERWRLEELGGSLAVLRRPIGTRATRELSRA